MGKWTVYRQVTAVVAVAFLFGADNATADDAAMFRNGAAHTGVFDGNPITGVPRIRWTFHTNGEVISSPTVANGSVYFGGTDGRFYSVSAASGAENWRFVSGSRIASSPAVYDHTIFFENYDGTFFALDNSTGKPRWKFLTEGERRFAGRNLHGIKPAGETMPDPFDVFLSSPAIWNGTLYFGSGDTNVYALDARTGALKWKFRTGDVVHASPAVEAGTVFIGSWDSYFYALDAATGALRWRYKTGDDPAIHNQVGIESSAAVSDDTVYFGCRDSNLYALDAGTGSLRWKFNNKGSWVVASPAVEKGRVYAATSDSGSFYALDAKTGKQLFSLDFRHWPMFSSPAIVGNYAYIGSHTGKLLAIDLAGGRIAWRFATPASLKIGPTYTNPDGTPNYHAAFASDFYDDLVAGVSRMMSVGAILSSPVVAGGSIYFGSMDGNVYALSPG